MIYEKFNHCLLAQNGIRVKFHHIWPKNDGEKWSRKSIFEISSCGSHFLLIHFTSWKQGLLHKIKNGHLPAWRNFKNIFCGECTYDKWNFKPYKSSIFHFVLVNNDWISHTSCVKQNTRHTNKSLKSWAS